MIIILVLIIWVATAQFDKPTFQEDSLDNPENQNQDTNIQPMLLEGTSDIEVLLIHGLGATAWETKKLAEYLNTKNLTTRQILLAGHGSSIYDLEEVTSTEIYQSVEQEYLKMQKPNKFIIGFSFGSLPALQLPQNQGIILISTPIFFNDWRVKYTPILKYFQRFNYRDIESEHKPFYHENFPLKTLADMTKYIKEIKTLLPDIQAPILIIQSTDDSRIDPKSAQYIYDNIASEKKELVWLNSNKHVIIIDYLDEDESFKNERTATFENIYNFIIENSD